MNRIYKVIWNEALSCFTAVGEYAKGRGKSSKSSVSSNATINTTSNLSAIKTLRLSAIGIGLIAAGFGMQANAVGTYFAGDDSAPKIYTNPFYHQTLTVQGGETVMGDSSTKNISVMADRRDKSLTIKLDENVDLGADGSLKTGDTLVDNSGMKITVSDPLNNVVLGNNGLNNGNNQITGVADGLIALGSKEAINGGQLSSLATTVATNKTKYYSANSIGGDNEDNLGATGPNAIAMGKNAKAIGEQAIAIGSSGSGQDTKALGEQSIAIGANVVSTGGSSIAIGGDDLDTASEVAGINELSNAYTNSDLIEDPNNPYGHTESGGTASVAIGVKARSEGNLSTAVGVRSSSAGDASSAFGMGSSANAKGSVALGAGSAANVAGGEVGYIPTGANTAAITAIKNTQSGVDFGAVSVGTGEDGGNRQIVNVAAGSQDSDAVNVSQLKALDTIVAGIDFPIRSSSSQPYTTSVTGTNALAVGSNTNANGSNSTVVGENAFGNSNATAIGEGARSSYNGFAGGQDAKAGVNSVAIGQRATNGTASRAVAIGYEAKATAKDTVALGLDARAQALGGVALGKGSRANALNSVALGQNSIAAVQSGASFLTNVAADANNGTVSVGDVGSERRIINVAGGSADTDAVNVSQLKAVTDIANRGWDISAQGNSATASTVEPGESVDFNSTNSNIIVSKTASSNDVSFELNNNLDLGDNGSVEMGSSSPFGLGSTTTLDRSGLTTGNVLSNTTVNGLGIRTGNALFNTTVTGVGVAVSSPLSTTLLSSNGLNIVGGPSVTKSGGINAGNRRVINVDNGIQAKDAVNVSQLNSSSAAAKTEVAAGTNVAGVAKSTGGNGQDVYTVNADGVTASAGSTAVTVTAADKDLATNTTDYAVDLSADSKTSLVKADSAMQTVITQIDGDEVKTLNKTENTANFLSGKNIILTDENGDIKVSTLDEVEFTEVTTGSTLLNTGGVSFLGGSTVSLSSNGLDNGGNRIINVDDGDAPMDAVNVRQLESVKVTANRGWDISAQGNSGTASTVEPGESVDFNSTNSNIIVSKTANSNDVSFELNNDLDLGNSGSVSTGNIFGGTQVNSLGMITGGLVMGGVTTVSGLGVTVTGTNPLSNATLTSDGLSMIGGPSITKSNGINAGNKKIVNVDDGIQAKDAVNVRQLNSSSAAAKTEVSAGTNVAGVAKSTGGNGQDIYTVNADGVTASAGSTAVTVTASDKDTATNMTDYAIDLSADSKASLVKADSAMQTVVAQIDGNAVKTLNQTDNTANFITGDNIVLTAENDGIKIATAENVAFTSVTTGDTLLNTGGVSFLGGSTVSLSSNGLNNGNNQITNVASGVGDDFNAANIGDVNRASAAAKTEVAAGTNVAGVAKSTGGNGQDVYTVNADGTTVSKGSDAVTVTAGEKDTATNMTDYAIDLSADSKASLVKADSAIQTIVAQIDGNAVKTLNQTDNTANFITGDNIVLTAENDGIKIATKDDVTFTSVSFTDSPVRLSSDGLNNGGNKITNVDDGEADTDAVNVRQLNATNSTVDLGLNFTGDDTAAIVNRKLGQTLTIQGGATELTENNIGVIADEDGNLNVRLAEDVVLGTNGSVRMENTVLNNAGITITDGPKQTVTLSNEGLDNGNNRIIKVGEGIAPSDAVNFAQLTTTNNEIAKGIRIGDGNSANDQQFALGDTINVTGDRNLTTVASATGVQVKLNNQLDLGDDGSIQIGNSIMSNAGFTFVDNGFGRMLSQASQVSLTSRGLDNGGNTITNIGAGTLDSDAVNVGQLKEVAIALDQGWGITAQGDIATMVKQGDALDLNSTDGNIKVSRTSVNNVATTDANDRVQAAAIPAGVNDISFDLNPDISLNSVTTGDTTINSDGLTIVGGPSITKSGINAAGNKVTNIQNGEVTVDSQDAINGSQLHAQGSGISSIIGGATVYNAADGTFTNSNIGGTGEGSIDGAIASIRQGTIEINETVKINTTAISTNTSNIATNTTNIATNTTNIATNTSNITTNTTNIQSNTDKIDAGLNFGADSGADINKPVGDDSVLSFTGGNNITTTAEGSSIKFDLNGNINVDSVTTGTTVINSNGISMQGGPSMTAQGINAGSQRITGVADGIEATDAVNYSQLSALDSRLNSNMSDLGYKINEVEDDANAGISAAMAMSALPQAYISGKSLIGGGVSTYNGESAVAVGFSKLSNDGRWVIKVNGTADTQGNVGGAVGAGFHFD
ncbi:ESPR-type extended signal peptide-containing protein [Psychrobacter sp. SWN149]|uniref:ESPR-type extended signal peptide-containing protein n=1 Tax=Psychrobacter sp. SWN149 TaxID=2792057 RepID=UPI0018CDE9C3|nr:YadA-like family protein [Psychrobacter sp. SWN149]MBH0006093.1 YadA-like family protein [Psychrobacter sp. SWN149]